METPKPRRFARACDNCHRRRVKCYWRSPACPDCAKKGIECTFTTIKKTSLATDVPTHGHNAVWTTSETTESSSRTATHPPVPRQSVIGGNPVIGNEHEAAVSHERIPPAQTGRAFLVIVDEYFRDVNRFLPVYDRDLFLQQMMDPDSEMATIGDAVEMIVHCSVHQQRTMDTSKDRGMSGITECTNEYLKQALTASEKLLLATPSVARMQALTLLSVCLVQTPGSEQAGNQIMTCAIRMAQTLGVHLLDGKTNLGYAERLEQLRCFWCLYILDREICLRFRIPPIIDDEDMSVIEPQVVSNDRCGIVGALDGSRFINFFAARQRLARIQSQIRAELHTFRARHRPHRQRAEAVVKLNRLLATWKTDWFDFGETSEIRSHWPKETMALVLQLQLTYFLNLLQANPELPQEAETIESLMAEAVDWSNASRITPDACRDAARDTLHLGTGVRWSAHMPHLGNILQTAVPAMLVMLYGHNFSGTSRRDILDLGLIEGWVSTIGKFAEAGKNEELRRVYRLCIRMGSRNPFETPV